MSSRATYFLYSLPAAPLGMLFVLYLVYVPKIYVDYYSLTAGFVSGLLFFSRIWDAVLDPIIGTLSDRSRLRWGRRKPFIFIGLLPLLALIILIFVPQVVQSYWSIYLASLLLFFFYSSCSIPYEAWGVDLCTTSKQRTEMSMWREGTGMLGALLALSLPAILGELNFQNTTIFGTTLALILIFLLISFGLVLFKVQESKREKDQLVRSSFTIKDTFLPLRQSEFRILLFAFLTTGVGTSVAATLFLFYVEDYLQSTHGAFFLLIYFASGILSLPVWLRVSNKFSKKNTWIAALLLNCLSFGCIYFLKPGDEVLYGILVLISGLGFGASLTLPASIQIDIIESTASSQSVRSEGHFFGLWSLTKKLSAATGAAVALYLLSASSQESTSLGGAQRDPLLLRDLYVLLPTGFMILASVAASFLPNNNKEEI